MKKGKLSCVALLSILLTKEFYIIAIIKIFLRLNLKSLFDIEYSHRKYILAPADKADNSIVVV